MMKGFVLAATLAIVSTAAAGEELIGQASVIDGDTIEIHGKRIRLWGIDAPESAQTCERAGGEAYRCGQAAANTLADHIGGRPVTCEPRDVDRYGRTVATCRIGGLDVADILVRAGMALDYTQYSRGAYQAAQAAADAGGMGVWNGPFVEPWLYRACIRAGGRPGECSAGAKQ